MIIFFTRFECSFIFTGLTPDPDGYVLLKITQLVELLAIRHCVFMMGAPGSFKSTVWKVLAKAKDAIGEKLHSKRVEKMYKYTRDE